PDTCRALNRNLSAGVGVALSMAHGAQRGGELSGVATVVLATEGEHGILLAAVAAQGVRMVHLYARVLSAMHDKGLAFEIQAPAGASIACCGDVYRAGLVVTSIRCRDIVGAVPAVVASAASKGAGRVFPLASARRMIPAHAF